MFFQHWCNSTFVILVTLAKPLPGPFKLSSFCAVLLSSNKKFAPILQIEKPEVATKPNDRNSLPYIPLLIFHPIHKTLLLVISS